MAYCDLCGNFDSSHFEDLQETYQDIDRDAYQPDLYYYWDAPLEEDYDWRDEIDADCLCEICFDIANSEKRIKWKLPRCQSRL
jgi:hypothetical protein